MAWHAGTQHTGMQEVQQPRTWRGVEGQQQQRQEARRAERPHERPTPHRVRRQLEAGKPCEQERPRAAHRHLHAKGQGSLDCRAARHARLRGWVGGGCTVQCRAVQCCVVHREPCMAATMLSIH